MNKHAWLGRGQVVIMTMREADADRWNPRELVEFARGLNAGALGFSVGGITAFYPTRIPFHRRSPNLGDRDPVGETVGELHRAGLRAIGRIDPSLARTDLFNQHPDWFSRDRSGRPVRVHDLYVTCPNGAYYHRFMLDVVREILDRYPLDGLWASAAQFSPWHTPQCFCTNCRTAFGADTGEPLPDEDWADPVWHRYVEWRYGRIANWVQVVRDVVRETRPDCAWLPLSQAIESWDHTRRGGWDPDITEPFEDGIVLEAQRRYPNLWWSGMEARFAHSLQPAKSAGLSISYFFPWWRFYQAPVAENRVWTAQAVANGARPWLHVTGFYSEHFDRRGLAALRDFFAVLNANEEAYTGRRSAAEVGLVYSRRTLDHHGADSPERRYLDAFRGTYNMLIHQRQPFDLLVETRLERMELGRYRTLVLPNLVCLSDAAAEALVAYVRSGGHLVCTYMTGLCDDWGRRRPRPLLTELLELGYEDTPLEGLTAAYARINDPDDPILNGIGDTDILPLTGGVCVVRPPEGSGTSPLVFIPPVESEVGSSFSVPEFNVAPIVTETPLVVSAPVGHGRVVYMPWEPDRIAFSFGLDDLFHLLGNAVRAAPGWDDLIRLDGPGLVDISVMGNEGSVAVHIVNFSFPGAFHSSQRRLVEEVMQLENLTADLRLPAGKRCKSVRLILGSCQIPFDESDGRVRFTIPRMAEFETVLLDLS